MFVYLLRHAAEPRFKIGKANDIYQRIPGIGGISAFDLERSLCLHFGNEADAYRLEKVLHRVFDQWAFGVDETGRYPGDTEQFKIECFDRVVKFLTDIADLTCGASLQPLPPRPQSPPRTVVSQDEIERRRAEARAARSAEIEAQHEETLQDLRTLARSVESGDLLCGIWKSASEPNVSRFFTYVPTGDEQCLGFLRSRLIRTFLKADGGGLTSIFGGCSYHGNIGIHDFYAGALSEATPHEPVFQESLPVQQKNEMVGIVSSLPRFNNNDVFSLLRTAGMVDFVETMGIDGLKDRIRRVMLYLHSGQFLCHFDRGSGSLAYWIVAYCFAGLSALGVPEDAIRAAVVSIRDKAKQDLKLMPREEDPMWGYYVYETPLCL